MHAGQTGKYAKSFCVGHLDLAATGVPTQELLTGCYISRGFVLVADIPQLPFHNGDRIAKNPSLDKYRTSVTSW